MDKKNVKNLKILHFEVCKWTDLVTSTKIDFKAFGFFLIIFYLFFKNSISNTASPTIF